MCFRGGYRLAVSIQHRIFKFALLLSKEYRAYHVELGTGMLHGCYRGLTGSSVTGVIQGFDKGVPVVIHGCYRGDTGVVQGTRLIPCACAFLAVFSGYFPDTLLVLFLYLPSVFLVLF